MQGVSAAIEHEEVAFGHDFASVIDVGAHHGQFALLASRRFPNAMLWCFEPLPEAQKKLKTVADHSRVMVIGAAAGKHPSEQELHVSRASDSSSLLPILGSYTTAFPGTEEDRRTSVSVVRLDDVFEQPPPRPSLLKIDSQGSELDVLAGAERLLRSVDAIFVECSFVEFYAGQALISQVIAHLLERSFFLAGVYSVVRDRVGRCLQADLLFATTERHGR
ncbi:MAG: FkbM family methyltransferase [Thermoleophilaceae bacterium]|nr:FkbM family methyltransferase [Thermoleophilaceae bacterium]